MIGFMQGRLLSPINETIQYFPDKEWKKEFLIAKKNNFELMEWTINYDNINLNPLINENSLELISYMSKKFNVKIESVTCDFLMENLFLI